MPKVAYVPYNDVMAAIFAALGVTITPEDFGGQQGWALQAYTDALAAAWTALQETGEINIDEIEGDDDWDAIEALIHGVYTINYWSTEKEYDPS